MIIKAAQTINIVILPVIVLLIICSTGMYAQEYENDQKKFIFQNNVAFEITYEDSDFANLVISKKQNNQFKVSESIILDDIKVDADLIAFGNYINEIRKFIIIKARYSFYILNLYNHKLLGPFKPKFYGIGDDSQSSMLVSIKIILDGRFIIGYCVDSGPFLFDLTSLYYPKEIPPVSNSYLTSNNIFVLEHVDKQNKYFGLFITANSWEVKNKIIFTNKSVKPAQILKSDNLSEEEIENLSNNSDLTDSKYTILEETNDQNTEFVVYDNFTGKQILLPTKIRTSKIMSVKEYLKQLPNE